MARSVATSIENNFINGLVTEATALNFPEAAAIDTYNCIFEPKMAVTRRFGMNFEPSYSLNTINRNDVVVSTFLWQNAAGSGDNNFVVLQVGSLLTLYNVGSGSLSGAAVGTIDLTDFSPVGAPSPALKECQFAYGKGFLFVVHPNLEPFYVAYDVDTEDFTAEQITVKIRDFDGLEDDLENDDRPSTLSDEHRYNLYNQGWAAYSTGGLTDLTVVTGSTIVYPTGYNAGDPLATWDAGRTDFPSNADVWWLYKDAQEVFQPKYANTQRRGNSPAPKGFYILDAFNQDRSTASGITGFTPVTSGAVRPKAVAFFASRAWFAGVDADGYSNKIYFSQQIKSRDTDFGKCYQQNDPTSEHSFDLLPTDGGEIQILDCGRVVKLIAMQNSMIVFATNGVWGITGSQGVGFTASDFSIRKISSVPAISPTSFVDISGTPAWWNTDGIYTIGGNDTLGQQAVQSLTEKKIKSFFDDIPADNKNYVRGYFDPLSKVVQWLYRSTPATSLTEHFEFDTVMNLNTITGAFYPWRIDSEVTLNGIVSIQGNAAVDRDGTVTTEAIASFFKYLVSFEDGATHKLTFAEVYAADYKDFFSYDSVGIDAPAYLVSGYKVHGDAQKRFQTNYLFIFCDNERPARFHCQSIWDYATNSNTGDYGSKQLISWAAEERAFRVKRVKLRGMGLTLQIKMTSIPGEPFNIVGWSAFETGNSNV